MCNKLHTASVCSELDVWLTPRDKCRLSLLVWRRYVLEPSTYKNPAYSLSFHSPNKGKLVPKSHKHILTIFKVRTETSAWWYQTLIPSSLVCTRQCQSSKQEPKLIVRPDYQLNSHTYPLNMTSGLPESKKQALSLLTRTWLIKLTRQLSMESICHDLRGGDWWTQSAVFWTTTTVHCMEQGWLNSLSVYWLRPRDAITKMWRRRRRLEGPIGDLCDDCGYRYWDVTSCMY